MNIRKVYGESELTVYINGKLDASTAPQVKQEIKPELKNINSLILDIADLEYISSAGLRVILSFHKKLKSKGTVTIRNANKNILDIFDLTGFNKIINIE